MAAGFVLRQLEATQLNSSLPSPLSRCYSEAAVAKRFTEILGVRIGV